MNDKEKIDFIKEAIFKMLKKDIKINLQDKLVDLGLDSLDVVELQVYYEENTGDEIPDGASIVTVEDLMRVIK